MKRSPKSDHVKKPVLASKAVSALLFKNIDRAEAEWKYASRAAWCFVSLLHYSSDSAGLGKITLLFGVLGSFRICEEIH